MGVLVQPRGSKQGLPWGLLCGTSGRRKLCLMPCHSCHICGIWRSKRWGDALKSSFGVTMQATKGDSFYGERGFSSSNTENLLYYWDWKTFYRILRLFPILLLFYLFCIYWEWKSQKCNLKCPKFYEINTEL